MVFFLNDGGFGVINFGGINPPSRETVVNSIVVPPIVPNVPLAGEEVFFELENGTLRPIVPVTGKTERPIFTQWQVVLSAAAACLPCRVCME
jgi:hypothetical protein